MLQVYVKLIIFTPFVILFPIVLNNLTSPFELLVVQCFIVLFAPVDFPARAILYMYFPVFKRFTASIFLAALSKAAMYVTTAFGFVYLIKYFGNWGLLIIVIPIQIGFMFGLRYFKNLEVAAGNYH